MKAFRIRKIVLPAVLALGMASCSKTLDIKPTDIISAENAILSVTDLEQAALGVYGALGNTNVASRTAGNADIIISSLMSDENYLPLENVGGSANTYRWHITPDDQNTWANWGSSVVSSVFTGSNYAVIDRANRLLKVIDDIPAFDNEDSVKKARIKAELLALRAHCHFQVLKSYAENYEPQSLGVPYMESINPEPEKVQPSRLSAAETFSKIERDLQEAKSLMPANTADVLRITPRAILAIQARVFLYEKRWDLAIKAATEVISAVPLAARDAFNDIWADKNNQEIIWKLKRDADNDKIGQFYRNTSYVEYAASPKLVSSYRDGDIRFSSYINIDKNRGNNKTQNIVSKYAKSTTAGLADLKLYRAAEMYLIRAEAYTETGFFPEASADLNKLRAARMLAYVPVQYNDAAALIEEIYLERFRELAFEGHRYFDLRRRSRTIDRRPLAPDDNSGGAIILTADQREYYLPIPSFELRANKNIVQNPQYK